MLAIEKIILIIKNHSIYFGGYHAYSSYSRNGTCKGIYTYNKRVNAEIIGLTHGHGVNELLGQYCTEIHSIGQSRGQGATKKIQFKDSYLWL